MSGRRGRRDNGLDAPLWHPLRDVDPRVGEHLLDVLREEGIAAYLAPSQDHGPYTRTQFLPSPPTDRLFVDRSRRAEARTVVDTWGDEHVDEHVDEHAAEPVPAPVEPVRADSEATDAEFARIVAAWEAEHGPAAAVTPAPAQGPVPDDVPDGGRGGPAPDEHYEPPAPPPLPAPSPHTLYAVLLVAAGAVCIIAPAAVRLSSDVGILVGVLAVVGGVALLVSRMRERTDDGDDGAVV